MSIMDAKPDITLSWYQAQELLPLAENALLEAVKKQKLADQDNRLECYGVEDWQEIVDTLNGNKGNLL